jgi:hypothetical protein
LEQLATAVTPAESAPAEPQPNFSPETFTPAEHTAWMEKGTIPEVKPETQAGAPQGDKPAAESAPASQQEQKGTPPAAKNADQRKAELNREIQDLLAQRNSLRAEVQQPKPDVKADPPPAAAKPDKPKPPSFGETGHEEETWAQFESRQQSHVEALAEFKAREVLRADREEREQQSRKAEQEAQAKTVQEAWSGRVEAAKSKLADFAEVAFSETTPLNDAMLEILMDSERGPEILYQLGLNGSAEGKRIFSLSKIQAQRELLKIEGSLSEPAKEPPKPAPVVPITKAARPAVNLNATGGAPVDPLRDAVERDDVAAYFEEANRRDVERRKRG